MLRPAQDLYRTTFSANDNDDIDGSPQPHSSHTKPKRRKFEKTGQMPQRQPLIEADSSDDSPLPTPKRPVQQKKVTFAMEPTPR